MFRAKIDVVALVKILEYQGYPAGKWHIVGSFGATDQFDEMIEEELGKVCSFVVDDAIQ